MPDTWPNDKLEREMLADADMVDVYFNKLVGSACAAACNCACHVRALLERVRTLESQLGISNDR